MSELPFHHTERLAPGNIHHLVILFRKVFKKRVSIKYLRGKYNSAYLGKSYYGYIAYDDKNNPIAFHGCVPFKIQYKDKVELGAQFGDAMTLKKYNGKGIFTILGKMTEDILKQEGIHFSYGLPNQNSEYGYYNKLKWVHKERMTGFRIRIFTFPYEKIMRRLFLGYLYQRIVKMVLKKLIVQKQLLHSFHDGIHASVLKDDSFYSYKSYTPNHVIMVNGVKAWIKAEGIMQIGEIGTSDETTLLNTLRHLKKLARVLGLNQMVIQYSPGTWQEKILLEKYPSFVSWAICYQNYTSDIPLDMLKFNYGDLDTF